MKAMKAGARAMTGGVLTKKIAESTQLKTKDVKGVLAALRTIACAEVKKTEKFVIPQLTTLKLKHKPARKAGKKMMFGKEVHIMNIIFLITSIVLIMISVSSFL